MKKIYLLLLFLLISLSCQKEEMVSPETQEQDHLSAIKAEFSLSKFQDEYIKNNLKINWNEYWKNDNDESYSFTTSLNSQLNGDKKSLFYKYHLIALQIEGNWKFKLAKFIAADKTELNKATLENNENFTGTHSLYDLTGKLLEVKAFEDGEVVSEFSQDSLSKNHLRYAPPIGPSECAGCGWMLMRTYRVKDWFHTGTDSNGNFYFNYTHSSYEGSTSEWVYVYNPGGYNEGYGDYAGGDSYHEHYNNPPHGPAINENPHDYERVEEEDKIDASKLEGKTECVYTKMVDEKNNINWILENFKDGDKPSDFDLIFEMSNTLGDETNASFATPTQSGIPNTFVIRINKNRAENINTTLTIARTLIHEGIHARLWEFAYRNGKTVNPTDFPGVYEYMREYGRNWDHQQMADFYRNTIAMGLKQFDNGQHSDAFYDALAWEGLSEIKDQNGNGSIIFTEAWKNESNKTEILNIIKNHKENGSKVCN